MREIKITSRQQLLPPDILALELGLITSPQEIEKNQKLSYILIGVFATVTVGIIAYTIHQKYQESKIKVNKLKISH